MCIRRFFEIYWQVFQNFVVYLLIRLGHFALLQVNKTLNTTRNTLTDALCTGIIALRRLFLLLLKLILILFRYSLPRMRRAFAVAKWATFNKLLAYEEAFDVLRTFLAANKRVISISAAACVCVLISGSALNASATFYEYSVGGTVLGVVKDEAKIESTLGRVGDQIDPDNAEKILISTKSGENVVIDKDEDISIEKKFITPINPVNVDSEQEIVDKISALENIKIMAYAMTVNDNYYGTFESMAVGQAILDKAENYLLYGEDIKKLKEISWSDDIIFTQTETPKNVLSDPGDVYNKLMEPVISTKEYTVKSGDTLNEIASKVNLTVKKLGKLNPEVDMEALFPGDKLNVGQAKALLHLKTTEEIEYDETYRAKPEYNNTSRLYAGQEIIQSAGEPGRRHVVADLIRENGKLIREERTSIGAWQPSVPAQIMRGTKKMPEEVGKGWLIWPTSGPLTSAFAYRWGRFHEGIDIGARYSSVYAADAGHVVFAGNKGDGYGNKVIINHGNGRETLYAHLSSIDVKVGQLVYQGQYIAVSGSTGYVTGPHLHFGVYIYGVPKNPRNYF